MRLKITLLVFTEGVHQGDLDLIAEYPDPIAALTSVAQLGAANSQSMYHPEVRKLFEDLPPSALARLHERLAPGSVVQIMSITEHREMMPEELRNSPNARHIIAARPAPKIPPEGIFKTLNDGITVH